MSSEIEADAVLFDVYLTLIDIHTDEAKVELWDKLTPVDASPPPSSHKPEPQDWPQIHHE